MGALAIVVIVAAFGGLAVSLINGLNIPAFKSFKGFKMRPVSKHVTIPPLVGMLLLGFITRNYVPKPMPSFPSLWANYIRQICLCLLMLRGGLTVSFAGKGITVLLMSFLPQFVEATVIALISLGLFNTPIYVSYTIGYGIACISPSIVVPLMMSMIERK